MLPLRAGRRAFLGSVLWFSLLWRRPNPALAQATAVGPLDSSARETLEAVVDAIVPRDQDPLIGTVIAALLALPIALHADPVTGKRYIWEIMIPGSIVGLIVGYATQRFGQPAAQRS